MNNKSPWGEFQPFTEIEESLANVINVSTLFYIKKNSIKCFPFPLLALHLKKKRTLSSQRDFHKKK